MSKSFCGKCFDQANIHEDSVTSDGRTFKVYLCPTCKSLTRVFDVPVTEAEVVLVALVTDALSDNVTPVVPERELRVEQLLMFPDQWGVHY